MYNRDRARVYAGLCYSSQYRISLDGSETKYFVFDCSGSGCDVENYPPVFTGVGGPILITIYGGTDYTGVDSLPVNNRNVKSGRAARCTLKDQATGTEKGIVSSGFVVPSNILSGGNVKSDLPFLLNGFSYLIEVENTSGVAATLGYQFIWFEKDS